MVSQIRLERAEVSGFRCETAHGLIVLGVIGLRLVEGVSSREPCGLLLLLAFSKSTRARSVRE